MLGTSSRFNGGNKRGAEARAPVGRMSRADRGEGRKERQHAAHHSTQATLLAKTSISANTSCTRLVDLLAQPPPSRQDAPSYKGALNLVFNQCESKHIYKADPLTPCTPWVLCQPPRPRQQQKLGSCPPPQQRSPSCQTHHPPHELREQAMPAWVPLWRTQLHGQKGSRV